MKKTNRCSDCHTEKPLEGFYKCADRRLGVRSTCKKCDSLRARKHRDEHRNDLAVQYRGFFKLCKKRN